MKKKNLKKVFISVLAAAVFPFFGGCATYTTQVENAPGRPTVYAAPDTVGPVAGIGIESQDIISMCDKMMRTMMANPLLANASSPPHIIVDAAYFRNESSSRINLNMITDRLRLGLNQYANGRMIFVGRHYADMVDKERRLKDNGKVDRGTTAYAAKTLGGDYRLGGRITSLDAVAQKSGLASRFTQVIFEMVDLQTGAIAWGGQYSFKKAAADDVIYR